MTSIRPLSNPGFNTGDAFWLAKALKALACEKRLLIVAALLKQPRTCMDLAFIVGVTQPTVSHHLRVLEQAGIVAEAEGAKPGEAYPRTVHKSALTDLGRLLGGERR